MCIHLSVRTNISRATHTQITTETDYQYVRTNLCSYTAQCMRLTCANRPAMFSDVGAKLRPAGHAHTHTQKHQWRVVPVYVHYEWGVYRHKSPRQRAEILVKIRGRSRIHSDYIVVYVLHAVRQPSSIRPDAWRTPIHIIQHVRMYLMKSIRSVDGMRYYAKAYRNQAAAKSLIAITQVDLLVISE